MRVVVIRSRGFYYNDAPSIQDGGMTFLVDDRDALTAVNSWSYKRNKNIHWGGTVCIHTFVTF